MIPDFLLTIAAIAAFVILAELAWHLFQRRHIDRPLPTDPAAQAANTEQQGRPASDPPNRTGVYLIHDGLGFGICEYFTGVDDGDGTCAGWIPENDDEIYVVRWWHLPDVPQREPQP